jgi:hypothetical protein
MNQVNDYYGTRTKSDYQTYPQQQEQWYSTQVEPQSQSQNQKCQQDGNKETCQSIHQETNTRIYDRNVPSQLLQSYIDVRPVSTKYSLLPIVDPRAKPSVPYIDRPTYRVSTTFNPGNRGAPWSGYSSHVNVESELRNQVYALQKCSQAVYVPSSTSDLYDKKIFSHSNKDQPFPYLFETERFSDFNPNVENVGQHTFLNNTRMEYRDLSSLQNNCG